MNFTPHDSALQGRNLDEYCAMFDIGPAERQLSILGVGDGPSSFNVEGTAAGLRIVSVDPLYALRREEVRQHIDASAAAGATTDRFLADYDEGIAQGRYVTGSADALPFPDSSYDLALCSHCLFIHSAQHDLAFHLKAIRELTRVAEEVRIFPLLQPGAVEPGHLRAVLMALARMGLKAERRAVPGGLQRDANQMLVITR